MTKYAERLISARAASGLSQAELAALAGIAPAQISRYESGRTTPRPQISAKLAATLGVDNTWLLFGQPAVDYSGSSRMQNVIMQVPEATFMKFIREAHLHGRPVEDEICFAAYRYYELRDALEGVRAKGGALAMELERLFIFPDHPVPDSKKRPE